MKNHPGEGKVLENVLPKVFLHFVMRAPVTN